MAASLAPFLRQLLLLASAPRALRWRLETFGLYMPSLPDTRPWWRLNGHALRALLAQLPGYVRWLAEIQTLREAGAAGLWRARANTSLHDWEDWLTQSG